jgi:hypothetical protein
MAASQGRLLGASDTAQGRIRTGNYDGPVVDASNGGLLVSMIIFFYFLSRFQYSPLILRQKFICGNLLLTRSENSTFLHQVVFISAHKPYVGE